MTVAALVLIIQVEEDDWDCAIIAAASALGCRELYTEDMSDGREVEGVLIVNPFR